MEDLKFRVSTGLKNIIGKELIVNDTIAIFELVKNSYDAKSAHIRIIFNNILGPKSQSKIFIVDDGKGMSLEDIEEKWLAVGFSEKKFIEPKEIINKKGVITSNRAFAGAKGIGRFSADRLGRFFSMYTRQQKNNELKMINLDWKNFEKNQEENFDSIDVNYNTDQSIPKEVTKHVKFGKGTIIEIADLNSNWSRDKVLNLKKYLQRLINPTIEKNIHDFKIEIIAPEFFKIDEIKDTNDVSRVNGFIKNIVFEKFEKQTTRVSCNIIDGKIYTKIIDKGNLIFQVEEDNLFSKLENIYVHIFYLTPTTRTSFRKIMGMTHREYGSIFLYKNGFRVHPYGAEDDDWLGLEKRKGQGYARNLANREVIGRVEIYGKQQEFRETSSRDGGIINSEGLTQLKKCIVKKALVRLEKYVVDGIHFDQEDETKKKSPEKITDDSLKVISKLLGKTNSSNLKITIGKNIFERIKDREIESIPEIIRNLEIVKKAVKTNKEKEYIDNQLKTLRVANRNITKIQSKVKKALEIKIKETYFLRKETSGDKQIIMNLNHSIKNLTKKIDGYIMRIGEKIKNDEPIESIIPWVDKISRENKKVKSLAKIVSISNFNVKAKSREDDLVEYIKEYAVTLIRDITDLNLIFYNDNIDYHTKFIPLEISTMLDNLIDNSIKADAVKVAIRFEKRQGNLHIYYADNGKGIKKEQEEKLFTRGYSTTSGSGLGIYHIKAIAEEHGGSMMFVGNNYKSLGKGAVFEVILNGAN